MKEMRLRFKLVLKDKSIPRISIGIQKKARFVLVEVFGNIVV